MTTIGGDGSVQLVNVRAPDAAMAQRIAELVDDAIRVATTSGEMPGRVVVVRDFDIGNLPPSTSPASIARLVNEAVKSIALNAVRGDDSVATTAPVVYFKDEADVVRVLAQRVATNKPTTEWFWPSVVKGWTPNVSTDRAITMLIERAMSTNTGVVTLAQVVNTLASTGALDKLLERLSAEDGRALLKAIGWTETMIGGGTSPDANPPIPHLPTQAQMLVQRWVTQWGGDARDPRALWLGAMLLVADQPGRSASAQLPDVVRVWVASLGEQAAGEGTPPLHPNPATLNVSMDVATLANRRADLIADARAWLQSHPRSTLDSLLGGGPPAPLAPRNPLPNADPLQSRRDEEGRRPEEHEPDEPLTWKRPRATNFAGFLFLIPLLGRVGLDNIVASNPTLIDRDWPAALLLRLARRLGVPHDDCAVAWIAARPMTIAHTDRALTAEVLRAARIRLRMEAQRTMRDLVDREGSIVAAKKSVDVFLPPAEVDADLRRGELADQSGVVLWLGRVVQIHVVDAVDLNA